MRLLVVSDSHRRNDNLKRVFQTEKFDAVIHLGDSEDMTYEIERMLYEVNPSIPIKFIRGNCDDDISIEAEVLASYLGVKIFSVHGHRQRVNAGREMLAEIAREKGACIALYGHTHRPDLEGLGGVYVFNPGSITEPRQFPPRASYGIIEIERGKEPLFKHYFLD